MRLHFPLGPQVLPAPAVLNPFPQPPRKSYSSFSPPSGPCCVIRDQICQPDLSSSVPQPLPCFVILCHKHKHHIQYTCRGPSSTLGQSSQAQICYIWCGTPGSQQCLVQVGPCWAGRESNQWRNSVANRGCLPSHCKLQGLDRVTEVRVLQQQLWSHKFSLPVFRAVSLAHISRWLHQCQQPGSGDSPTPTDD